MKLHAIKVQLCFCFLTVVSAYPGDVVEVTLPSADVNDDGSCRYPHSLQVQVDDPTSKQTWSLTLFHNEVPRSPGQIHILHQDSERGVYLETVDLDQSEYVSAQGYHNYHEGAAFMVKCLQYDATKPIFVLEGSVFRDGMKYQISHHSALLKPSLPRFTHVTQYYRMEVVDEHRAEDTAARLESAVMESRKNGLSQSSDLQRVKRQTSQTYYIDVLVFCDVSMYQRWLLIGITENKTLTLINNYLDNLLTSVNMRLSTLVLGSKQLVVRKITPIISKVDNTSPWNANIIERETQETKINATLLLKAFQTYLKDVFAFRVPHDHAVLMTSYDIYGGNDQGIRFNITKGLATVGGMCSTNGESSSIVEDKGAYQSEGVLAHELGHSLGSSHDGTNNNCPSSLRYLMSDATYPESDVTRYNPWKFSPCSSQAVAARLADLEGDPSARKCLTETVSNSTIVNQTVSKTADDQCKRFHGNESFVCRVSPFDKVCTEFYCRIPGTNRCDLMNPATGTCCRNNMRCLNGMCNDTAPAGECVVDAECPLADVLGKVLNDQTCAELSSSYCYLPDVQKACCNTCRNWRSKFANISACTYGDKLLACSKTQCGTNDTNGVLYDFMCCGTCYLAPPALPCVNTKTQNCTTCVKAIEELTRSTCYLSDMHASACSVECESQRNKTQPDCPWGDRKICTQVVNQLLSGTPCTSEQTSSCCQTCADYAIPSTASPSKSPSTATKPTASPGATQAPPTTVKTAASKNVSVRHYSSYSTIVAMAVFVLAALLIS
ncbi:zinc metalloproteinase/disintegrin-like [Physella acuta]|uniref:zinc metalloproteinase/disintegrin-like n=1 Tax=Physella acuta TaxID=109671 RepID=UPI0027DCD37A|nr:zinc metalloproteinase/disintegrin-like [Physella acuta]